MKVSLLLLVVLIIMTIVSGCGESYQNSETQNFVEKSYRLGCDLIEDVEECVVYTVAGEAGVTMYDVDKVHIYDNVTIIILNNGEALYAVNATVFVR